MAYAEYTRVPVQSSRAEIEKILKKAKAERIVTMDDLRQAICMFMLGGRLIRFTVDLPVDGDQVRRQRWRALLLVIKAKLESVESKITTVEDEFLAQTVMPDGQSFGAYSAPVVRAAIEKGVMPTNPLMIEGPRP